MVSKLVAKRCSSSQNNMLLMTTKYGEVIPEHKAVFPCIATPEFSGLYRDILGKRKSNTPKSNPYDITNRNVVSYMIAQNSDRINSDIDNDKILPELAEHMSIFCKASLPFVLPQVKYNTPTKLLHSLVVSGNPLDEFF